MIKDDKIINQASKTIESEARFRSMITKEIASLLSDPKIPLFVKVFVILVCSCFLFFSLVLVFGVLDWAYSMYSQVEFKTTMYLSIIVGSMASIMAFAVPVIKFSITTVPSAQLKERLDITHDS